MIDLNLDKEVSGNSQANKEGMQFYCPIPHKKQFMWSSSTYIIMKQTE